MRGDDLCGMISFTCKVLGEFGITKNRNARANGDGISFLSQTPCLTCQVDLAIWCGGNVSFSLMRFRRENVSTNGIYGTHFKVGLRSSCLAKEHCFEVACSSITQCS
jgi:hypothetical protein